MSYGWRVMVEHDNTTFVRDQLRLFIVYGDPEGNMRVLNPVKFELGEVLPDNATNEDVPEPSTIPRELAELLFEKMGQHLLGVDNPIREIQRLRAELGQANRRLDKLIDGIGRLGGNHS